MRRIFLPLLLASIAACSSREAPDKAVTAAQAQDLSLAGRSSAFGGHGRPIRENRERPCPRRGRPCPQDFRRSPKHVFAIERFDGTCIQYLIRLFGPGQGACHRRREAYQA